MFSYPLNRVPMTLGLQTCLGGVLVTVPSLAILRPEVGTLAGSPWSRCAGSRCSSACAK